MPINPVTRMFATRFNRIAAWLVALLLVATAWMLAERYLDTDAPTDLAVVQPEECDLNTGACSTVLPLGGEVRLTITPRPIPMLRELTLELELDTTARVALEEPDALELDLAGVEMYMGFQRPRLEHTGGGLYRGTTTLPICTTESMTWAATAMPAGTPEASFVQFRFVTARDHQP